MFEQRNIKRLFLKTKKQTKDFLLSAKSREFFVFLCFFFIAAGFWLLQTLNNDTRLRDTSASTRQRYGVA